MTPQEYEDLQYGFDKLEKDLERSFRKIDGVYTGRKWFDVSHYMEPPRRGEPDSGYVPWDVSVMPEDQEAMDEAFWEMDVFKRTRNLSEWRRVNPEMAEIAKQAMAAVKRALKGNPVDAFRSLDPGMGLTVGRSSPASGRVYIVVFNTFK